MQIVDLYRDLQKCPTGEETHVCHQQYATIHSTPFIINIMNNFMCTDTYTWHGDGVGNTNEENSSIFSVIQMH